MEDYSECALIKAFKGGVDGLSPLPTSPRVCCPPTESQALIGARPPCRIKYAIYKEVTLNSLSTMQVLLVGITCRDVAHFGLLPDQRNAIIPNSHSHTSHA